MIALCGSAGSSSPTVPAAEDFVLSRRAKEDRPPNAGDSVPLDDMRFTIASALEQGEERKTTAERCDPVLHPAIILGAMRILAARAAS